MIQASNLNERIKIYVAAEDKMLPKPNGYLIWTNPGATQSCA